MKKIIALGLMVTLGMYAGTFVDNSTYKANVVYAADYQVANNTEYMTADGYGAMPAGMPQSRAKMMARRAAIVDAQRNLVEMIKGAAIDAETTMENFLLTSDIVKTKVSGMITGARVISEEIESDGSYRVTMEVPMYGVGSVAEVAINAVAGNAPTVPVPMPSAEFKDNYKPEPAASIGSGYTGLVIDAKDTELVRTFCPAIYDTNGRVIYGVQNVDKDYAISKGIVEYAEGNDRWNQVGIGQSRAGNNPLYVKIVGLRERVVNKCDVIISVEDADKLLLENQRSGFLNNYSVVFEK